MIFFMKFLFFKRWLLLSDYLIQPFLFFPPPPSGMPPTPRLLLAPQPGCGTTRCWIPAGGIQYHLVGDDHGGRQQEFQEPHHFPVNQGLQVGCIKVDRGSLKLAREGITKVCRLCILPDLLDHIYSESPLLFIFRSQHIGVPVDIVVNDRSHLCGAKLLDKLYL